MSQDTNDDVVNCGGGGRNNSAPSFNSANGCQVLTGIPPSISKQGWFTELETSWPGQKFSLALEGFSTSKSILFHERSQYQDILVFRSAQYGTVLVLDDVLQLTERDNFAFHEMMVHVPLFAHPNPVCICIVGGGDGGCLREVLRHDTVRRVVLVEIDPRVIHVTKTFFSSSSSTSSAFFKNDSGPGGGATKNANPSMAAGFDDPRVEIVHEDAATYLANPGAANMFDIILSDTSDPVGPAESLFQPSFYESMHQCLKPQGIVCIQALCIWVHLNLISDLVACCAEMFDTAEYASTMVPTYPCGQIGFILACKDRFHSCRHALPRQSTTNQESILSQLKWYSFSQHTAAFTLPPFVEQRLEQKYDDSGGGSGGVYDEIQRDDDDLCFWQCFPFLRSWITPTANTSSRALLVPGYNDDDDDNNDDDNNDDVL